MREEDLLRTREGGRMGRGGKGGGMEGKEGEKMVVRDKQGGVTGTVVPDGCGQRPTGVGVRSRRFDQKMTVGHCIHASLRAREKTFIPLIHHGSLLTEGTPQGSEDHAGPTPHPSCVRFIPATLMM